MILNSRPTEPAAEECDAVTIPPSSSDGAELSEPTTEHTYVGDYEVIEEIARGGMGVVYLAEHRQLGRRVALKTLLIDCGHDTPAADRFAVEAEAVARLDHPGIVTIYEVGKAQGQPFIAMKFIDGETLAKLLHNGPLECDLALIIAIEAAEAIAHAHQRGVIHRDLKPANVIIDHAGHAVITDFGVAKFVESARCNLTTAGEALGTPHYMPPEQADATRGPICPASDVYSLGALMYAMLTGRPPFQAASPVDVMLQVLANDPVPLRRLNSTVSVTFEAIVIRCLQKDAKRRYQSATELAADLINFRDGKPTMAKPISGVRWALYNVRKHFMVATVSGSIVTLLILMTLMVVIAHVKLLTEKAALQTNLADMSDVLAVERSILRTRLSGVRNERYSEDELTAERLASYSSYVEKQNADLAVRLAVESIQISQKSGGSVGVSAVSVLRNHFAKGASNSSGADPFAGLSDADICSMIDQIEEKVTYQLSRDQRIMFGIEPPGEHSPVEPANDPSRLRMEEK